MNRFRSRDADGNELPDTKPDWLDQIAAFLADKWPTLSVLAVPVLAFTLIPAFRTALWDKLQGPDWWADNLIAFAVFTAGASWLVTFNQKRRESRDREQFKGWRWEIREDGKDTERVEIFWMDAERFIANEFDRWRAVRTNITTRLTLMTPTIADARTRWFIDPMHRFDPKTPPRDKTLIIDIGKMTQDLDKAPPRPLI